jgi:hypothetical protein
MGERLVVLDYGRERLYAMRTEPVKALTARQSRMGVSTTDTPPHAGEVLER